MVLLKACCAAMKTASEYRKHAQECRLLARQVSEGEQREQLLEMARTWDGLAESRERQIRNHPEFTHATDSTNRNHNEGGDVG
jgi:hypothetical protein